MRGVPAPQQPAPRRYIRSSPGQLPPIRKPRTARKRREIKTCRYKFYFDFALGLPPLVE